MTDSRNRTNGRTTRQNRSLAKAAMVVFLAFGLLAVWHWTPLSQWIDFETVAAWEQSFKDNPAAPYIVVAAYLLGGLVFFPVTLLTAVTVFTFGPVAGNAYALVGWLLSASLSYGIGKLLGQDLLRTIAGPRLERLDRAAERRGLIAVLAVRLLPVAPFTLVNLFVGASRIGFRDFVFGSLLGRIPGVLALTFFGIHVQSLLQAPALRTVALLLVALLLISLLNRWLARQFSRNLAADRSIGAHSKPRARP